MIKQAYFKGLMKVAQVTEKQLASYQKDNMLVGGDKIPAKRMKAHGFYKYTPIVADSRIKSQEQYMPISLRYIQAYDSASKFADAKHDPVHNKLLEYYRNIGRQNRDFYLKNGYRPPADHKYKTQFPYPTHPQKKQMMEQNQWQVNNNRGQQYSGHA